MMKAIAKATTMATMRGRAAYCARANDLGEHLARGGGNEVLSNLVSDRSGHVRAAKRSDEFARTTVQASY